MRELRPVLTREPVSRAIRVLRYLIDALPDPKGVRSIARALRMAPSTVHRSLATLQRDALVTWDDEREGYTVGLEFFRMAWRATSRHRVDQIALPIMRKLVDEHNETSVLSVYDSTRKQILFIAEVESTQQLRYVVALHEWAPLHAGASGLAILAHLPQDQLEAVVAAGLPPLTSQTITDPAQLAAELTVIRNRGYAITFGQRIDNAVAIAAPFLGPDQRLIGALALTIPAHRFEQGAEARLAPAVVMAAQAIAAAVGA